jgi:hypothetical protein
MSQPPRAVLFTATALFVCCCVVRGFDGSSPLVDCVQELVSNLGRMASQNVTKKLLCIECKNELPRADYKTSQWKLRANRTCKACQLLGILSVIPVEQHGALGGQSAAAAGDAASAGAGGDFVAGCLSAVPCARSVRFSQLGKTWGSLRWREPDLCFCSYVKHALLYERMTQFVCCRLQMTGFETPAAGGDAPHTPQSGCSVGTVTGTLSFDDVSSTLRVALFARGSIVVVGSGRVLASRCAP